MTDSPNNEMIRDAVKEELPTETIDSLDAAESNGTLEEELARKEAEENAKLADADVISSIVLFVLSAAVIISGFHIILFEVTGTDIWYYSPGLFPVFVGSVLLILSVLLFMKKIRASGRINLKKYVSSGFSFSWASPAVRILVAILLLAVYVFILIGRIHFLIATFIYLSVTMIIYRDGKIPVWKLVLISAVFSAVIYLFFRYVAAIPLP